MVRHSTCRSFDTSPPPTHTPTEPLPIPRAHRVETHAEGVYVPPDPCRPSELCSFIQESEVPQDANMDLVMVVDDSREVQADQYTGAQQLLGSVVQQLAVSKQPRRAGSQARVALVQQGNTHTSKPEFGLQTFQSHEPMRKHLLEHMHQHGGSAALGQTLEFSLDQVLLKAGPARQKKVVLALVGSRTSAQDRAKLHHVAQRAKCEGVTVFVATVGDRYDRAEVEQLASAPLQQHLVHLGRLDPDQQGYGRRFFRCFVSALNSESAAATHHTSAVALLGEAEWIQSGRIGLDRTQENSGDGACAPSTSASCHWLKAGATPWTHGHFIRDT